MAKNRSLRLQKKLHVGPFKQLGFALKLTAKADLTEAEIDGFFDAFFGDCMDANGLVFGGGLEAGWVDVNGIESATEAHRQMVGDWLRARPEIVAVEVGQLVDAWYGPFD